MDKEILRIVIIATGLVVILGMIAWSYFKGKKAERERDFFDDVSAFSDPQTQTDSDDYEVIPRGPIKSFENAEHYFEDEESDTGDDAEPTPRLVTPTLIQFSIVANADKGFNGVDLVQAFEKVGLEYGSLKIYERIDANRMVDYSVACMVEPGTFPDDNLDNFYCPGIVFFMQPGDLENAQSVFDDFVDTIRLLATDLDGMIWDHQRQPLTDNTVQAIRQSL